MTDVSSDFAPDQPLGVGSIIGESFSIFFRKIVTILLIAIIPSAVAFLLSGFLQGWDVMTGAAFPDYTNAAFMVGYVASLVIGFAAFGIIIAMMTQFAYDAKLGRAVNIGAYLRNGLRYIFPIIVLTIVYYVAAGIFSMAILVPGLWLMAVWFVFIPSIVIDGAGFRGLGRSARLTKNYRWPLVGLLILTFLIVFGVLLLVGGALGLFLFSAGSGFQDGTFGAFDILPLFLIQSITNAFAYGFGSVVVALAFARLKEIKEGVSVDDLVSVFE